MAYSATFLLSLGKVPGYYRGQLQHILAVTGLPAIDFWCYWPATGGPVLITERRDDAYIARLIEAEARFWQLVLAARGT